MLRRVLLVGVLTAVLCASQVAPAGAWANGVDGPDAYGTHDWFLDRAAQAAGGRVGWLHLRVALRATDDPDTRDGLDHASSPWWHVWDEWGSTYGGAPEAVSVWFRRARRRHEAGRDRAASRAVGIMAHMVGDIANPMHTDQSDREEGVHTSYEDAVDERSERSDDVYRFAFDGFDRVRPYAGVVALARRGHPVYRDLVRIYDEQGYNARVHRITKRQLNRGADLLADLLGRL